MELRPYQQEAKDSIVSGMGEGIRNTLLVFRLDVKDDVLQR